MLLFSTICCVNAMAAAVFNMLLLHLSMRGGYMTTQGIFIYYTPPQFVGFKLQTGWKTVDPHCI